MKQKNINYLDSFDHFIWLNGNYHSDGIAAMGCLHSLCLEETSGSFEQLRNFFQLHRGTYIFGYLSYDLKNDIENLNQSTKNPLDFPVLQFIVPETVISVSNSVDSHHKLSLEYGNPEHLVLFEKMLHDQKKVEISHFEGKLQPKIKRSEYIKTVEKIKEHIQLGDIYEMNYCYEYASENTIINPWQLYTVFNNLSRASFSAFAKMNQQFIMSASPERFFKKEGNKLTSQPIKGTIKRGTTAQDDKVLMQQLKEDKKERRENIMIVDLVRNDLSKIAKRGSVTVDELCEIYTFDALHQMISTISCELDEKNDLVDVIKAMFPMGSMTGAPKIRAMEIIDESEITNRGIYSGSLGYIKPNGDADFNVIIRTFLYDSNSNYLSYSVGSAITHASNPEKEFEETLLKAKVALELFS